MQRSSVAAIAVGLVLTGLAVVLGACPQAAYRLSGLQPLAGVDAAGLDDLSQVASEGTTEFFERRNRVELTVPTAMSAREFLLLNQLYGYRHVRREIAAQLGIESLADTTPLEAGQRFTVTLTPPEGDGL